MPKQSNPTITILKNGPYVVRGDVPVVEQHMVIDAKGDSVEWREGKSFDRAEVLKLCRCGKSKTRPYCDGTHKAAHFDGTESAGRDSYYDRTIFIRGPDLSLQDAEPFCAAARFCNSEGGIRKLVAQTDQPVARAEFLRQAHQCPAGRLVAVDNFAAKALEPEHKPSIGVVLDTREQREGPLWVRGGIPVIGADGLKYEVRNRVTLCRCGRSTNKPFCDGKHSPNT